jgi:hypothetical protein
MRLAIDITAQLKQTEPVEVIMDAETAGLALAPFGFVGADAVDVTVAVVVRAAPYVRVLRVCITADSPGTQ